MYTVAERSRLRDSLVEAARSDARVAGAALTGSAAVGGEDAWSDIDLALGLVPDADQDAVLADFTALMYDEHGAVHHRRDYFGRRRPARHVMREEHRERGGLDPLTRCEEERSSQPTERQGHEEAVAGRCDRARWRYDVDL